MRGKSKQQQKPIYGSFQSSHFLSKIRHCCEILNGGMTNKWQCFETKIFPNNNDMLLVLA